MPPKSRTRKSAATPIVVSSNISPIEEPTRRVTRSISRTIRTKQGQAPSIEGLPESDIRQPATEVQQHRRAVLKRSSPQKKQSTKATSQKLPSALPKSSEQREKRARQSKAATKRTTRRSPTRVAQIENHRAQVEPWLARVTKGAIPETFVASGTSQSDHPADPEVWYRRWGYEPPEHQEMNLIDAGGSVGASEVTSKGGKKLKYISVAATEFEFVNGLRERGITFNADADDNIDSIKKLILSDRPKKLTKREEDTWRDDLIRCSISDEALLQRTIMMEAIDRYELGSHLDYMCESAWTCTRLPRKNDTGLYRLALPKPDIAVAFKLAAVVSEEDLPMLGDLLGVMCPELSKREGSCHRAFPFFSMEVKGSQTVSGEPVANRQNFNNSSQALFNIYRFMRKAGQEDIFLNKVRFYSAIATTSSFEVRVHRAVQVKKRSQIEDNYPLGYRFDHLYTSKLKQYTRGEVWGIVKNILFEYGVKTLLPILKDAVENVLDKLAGEADHRASIGKRQAEDLLESFGSAQRQRLSGIGITDPADSQGSLSSHAVLAV